MKQLLKNVAAGLVIASIGIAVGYYLSPTKVRIEEKIVEKEKVVKEENRKVTEKFNPESGRLTERVTETGTKVTTSNKRSEDTKREEVREKKNWAVKAGAAGNPLAIDEMNLIPRVGGEARLPFFDTWAGLEADLVIKEPRVGLYLRMEF